MWEIIPLLMEGLGIGAEAGAGATATEATATKQSAKLAGNASKASDASKATETIQKRPNIFEESPEEKQAKVAADKEKREREESSPIARRYKLAENIEGWTDVVSKKSAGQAGLDWLKKNDPTGMMALATAGMDFTSAAAVRGMNAGRKAIGDDFVGLADEVLPDALRNVVHAFDDLTKAIVDKGRYLAKYSGELSYATAQADVRRMQADFREAQGPGRQYARVIDEQSQLETKLRDALNPVKESIAEAAANFLEVINTLIEDLHVKENFAMLGDVLHVLATFLTFDPVQILEALAELPGKMIAEWFKERPKEEDMDYAIKNAKSDLKRHRKDGPMVGPRNFQNGNFGFPILNGI